MSSEAHQLAHEATHPHIEEQFRSADQQREVATLGMWVFLATEILFFGGLFVAYAVYRTRWPADFRHGSIDLKWCLGGFNTGVLLLSSFFMAMAVHAAKEGDNPRIIRNLVLTMLLAIAFVGIKLSEYYIEYDEGLIPGSSFQTHSPDAAGESAFTRSIDSFQKSVDRMFGVPPDDSPRSNHEQLFMCFYFIMTGIHATHMLIGLGLMSWLIWMARRRRFSAQWHNPVEVIGLYWHFVDTVWVFLFPILYLLRNP
jgi:cytochrome c oxidase subunit 3